MIKNEEYIDYLKKVISCVSNGDYYSIKELSVLKLNTLNEETKEMKKNLHKFVRKNTDKKERKNSDKQEVFHIVNLYIDYLFNEIKERQGTQKIASIEEFIQEMQ